MIGYLRLIILRKLSEKEGTGYELRKVLADESNDWRPSFGTIYPLLKRMNDEGLLSFRTEGRRKIYRLTADGRRKLREIDTNKDKIMRSIERNMKVLQTIYPGSHINSTINIIKGLRSYKMPFGGVMGVLISMKELLIDMENEGSIRRNREDVKEVIKEAISRLRHIRRRDKEKRKKNDKNNRKAG